MKNRVVVCIITIILLVGCASPDFMGAESYRTGSFLSERWYKNPDYNLTLPSGTAGYGASAEALRDKFIIKYYIYDNNGNDTQEIEKQDIWFIKHNGKRNNKQDDDNLFYYMKTKTGKLIKAKDSYYNDLMPISRGIELPIRKCYQNGWCELYPSYDGRTLFIKKSILLKRLSDE
jgi:hypothetical protein